jgi:hypothetical protein
VPVREYNHTFVFCNFGKSFKIQPDVFAAWVRLPLLRLYSLLRLYYMLAAWVRRRLPLSHPHYLIPKKHTS